MPGVAKTPQRFYHSRYGSTRLPHQGNAKNCAFSDESGDFNKAKKLAEYRQRHLEITLRGNTCHQLKTTGVRNRRMLPATQELSMAARNLLYH